MIEDKSEVIKQEEEREYRWKWRWDVASLHGLDLDFVSSFPPHWSLQSPSFIHLISSYFPIPDTNKTMMKNEHHADECNDYLNAAFHYDYYWLELLDRIERRKEKRWKKEEEKDVKKGEGRTKGKFGKRIESMMRLIKGILMDIIHIVCVGSFTRRNFSLAIISDWANFSAWDGKKIFLSWMKYHFKTSMKEGTIWWVKSRGEDRIWWADRETLSLSFRTSKRERERERGDRHERNPWLEWRSVHHVFDFPSFHLIFLLSLFLLFSTFLPSFHLSLGPRVLKTPRVGERDGNNKRRMLLFCTSCRHLMICFNSVFRPSFQLVLTYTRKGRRREEEVNATAETAAPVSILIQVVATFSRSRNVYNM